MFRNSIIRLLCLSSIIFNVPCYSSDETNDSTYDYLKTLEIEELIKVEVTLDDVFDVFDGLVKTEQVSVATGKQQSAARAPAVTTVVTAMDIEAMGATDLDEVLETVPGLHVNRNGNWYIPTYTMRGSASSQGILLLINGNPIKELWGGEVGYIWAGMPINNIARIEVVRGPGSAVFGADAFTGVINIITKGKDDIKATEVGTRLGSFKTKEVWGLHGGTYGPVDLAVAAEYRKTDGHREIVEKDAQTPLDQKYHTHASLAPGPMSLGKENFDLSMDLRYGLWHLQSGFEGSYDIGPGAGSLNALSPSGSYNDERTRVNLNYHQPTLTTHWEVEANLNYLTTEWYNQDAYQYPPGSFGGLYPNGQMAKVSMAERHTRFDLTGVYAGFEHHLLRLGVGYYYGELYEVQTRRNYDPVAGKPLATLTDFTDTPYATVPENARQSGYASLQDIWTFNPQWELTAGLRYDHYSDFGDTINPRLALVWQPRDHLSAKLLYGRAFLAPTASQLYVYTPGKFAGNPDLKPEVINTLELAFDYRPLNNLNLRFNLFNYEINDKILAVIVKGINTYQNTVSWQGRGLELEARWKVTPKLSVIGHYSFQHAVDEKDNLLKDAPQHQGFIRTDWMLVPHWYLDARAKWVAGRERAMGDLRPVVEDYVVTDVTLRYKEIQRGNWNVALAIRNLFDIDAREPTPVTLFHDLPLAGRNYFLEWRYHF